LAGIVNNEQKNEQKIIVRKSDSVRLYIIQLLTKLLFYAFVSRVHMQS